MSQRVTWTVVDRRTALNTDAVLGVGLNVKDQEREYGINIALSHPADAGRPERDFVLDEFRRLRETLDRILNETSQ